MKLVGFTQLFKRYGWAHLVTAGGFLLSGFILGFGAKIEEVSPMIIGFLVFVITAMLFGLMTED